MNIRRRVKRLEQKAPDRTREPPEIVVEYVEPGTMRITGTQVFYREHRNHENKYRRY